jgi:hypothetical protein
MYHIFSTIHSKYQGETMFCFVCVATVFGYILGVNRVIDAIISKHSDETRVKVVKTMNKYTQTNLGEIAELLASNNIIIPLNNQTNMPCSIDDSHDNSNNSHDDIRGINIDTNEMNTSLNTTHNDITGYQDKKEDQTKTEDQEKKVEENTVMSLSNVTTSSISSSSPASTSEEDYELVRKNDNLNHSKHKKNVNYFEWLNIF